MNKIEAASPNPKRKVIDVQKCSGCRTDTPNPHLWYNPKTMPAVAKAMGNDLADLDPAHAAYFRANVATFVASLKPWLAAIAEFRGQLPRGDGGHD